jgi:hypothetical protein
VKTPYEECLAEIQALKSKLANAENEIRDLVLVNDEIFETDHHTIGLLVWCCIACCLIFLAVGVALGKLVL